jgi:hypothetical protein
MYVYIHYITDLCPNKLERSDFAIDQQIIVILNLYNYTRNKTSAAPHSNRGLANEASITQRTLNLINKSGFNNTTDYITFLTYNIKHFPHYIDKTCRTPDLPNGLINIADAPTPKPALGIYTINFFSNVESVGNSEFSSIPCDTSDIPINTQPHYNNTTQSTFPHTINTSSQVSLADDRLLLIKFRGQTHQLKVNPFTAHNIKESIRSLTGIQTQFYISCQNKPITDEFLSHYNYQDIYVNFFPLIIGGT